MLPLHFYVQFILLILCLKNLGFQKFKLLVGELTNLMADLELLRLGQMEDYGSWRPLELFHVNSTQSNY